MQRRPWIVGISGASGTPYAAAVLRGLCAAGHDVDLVVSQAARLTILDETAVGLRDAHWQEDLIAFMAADRERGETEVADAIQSGRLRYWAARDLAAGPSSGSYLAHGMVVVPASTHAVAGIALGLSMDLLQRAAAVTLKEGRRLVVVPRESPFTRAVLLHLLALHDAGAIVLPANPGFYHHPTNIADLVDFVAAKVLDVLGVEHALYARWTGTTSKN